jgi:hypothetical protein
MRTEYRRWSQYPYQGELLPPQGSPEPALWPMFFISRERNHIFLDPFRQQISWQIKLPKTINWERELSFVERTISVLTPEQKQIAIFWGTVEATERLIPIIFKLGRDYKIGSPEIARILGYFNAGVNDAFVMSWFFKYLWDVARPNQYDRNLTTALFTPRFPSYPSAHAAVAGCAETILSYFFPRESNKIKYIAEEIALSRLYAGVHFKVDNDEGLKLGRQIGYITVSVLRSQNVILNSQI